MRLHPAARDARRKRLILELVVNRLFQGPENVICQNVSSAQVHPLWLILQRLADGVTSQCEKLIGLCPAFESLVDLVGFEPTTSSMPWKRAPNCATGPLLIEKEPTVHDSTSQL